METDIDEIRRFLAAKKIIREKRVENSEPVVEFEDDDGPSSQEDLPGKKAIEILRR